MPFCLLQARHAHFQSEPPCTILMHSLARPLHGIPAPITSPIQHNNTQNSHPPQWSCCRRSSGAAPPPTCPPRPSWTPPMPARGRRRCWERTAAHTSPRSTPASTTPASPELRAGTTPRPPASRRAGWWASSSAAGARVGTAARCSRRAYRGPHTGRGRPRCWCAPWSGATPLCASPPARWEV